MVNKIIKMGIYSLFLVTNLYSASFDCKKASTFIENTICNDNELSKLDEQLAIEYKKVWNSLSDRTDLKNDQFDWLKNNRNKCISLELLKTSYINRILYLTNYDSRNLQTNKVTPNNINNPQTMDVNEVKEEQNIKKYEFIGSDDLESFPSDYVDKLLLLNCKKTTVSEDRRGNGYDIYAICMDSKGTYGFMGFNPFKIKVKTNDKNMAKEIAKSENQEKSLLGILKIDYSTYAVSKHIFEIHEVQYK